MSNKHVGSSLRSMFEELGEDRELKMLTLKKVISDSFRERMESSGVTQAKLATVMETSRTVAHRLLDPADTGVTLETLVRASDALGLDMTMSFRLKKAVPMTKASGGRATKAVSGRSLASRKTG